VRVEGAEAAKRLLEEDFLRGEPADRAVVEPALLLQPREGGVLRRAVAVAAVLMDGAKIEEDPDAIAPLASARATARRLWPRGSGWSG